ncbi:MAG: antitoxin [Chloroflexi bacterium]|nr:antitoxin [Chloroflexota bacterium]MBI3761706.1 antitoxin [Chloroflexota bacterium]
MIDRYQRLAERLRIELADLEREVQRAQTSWDTASRAGAAQDAYIDSVALNLHGFYSGAERLFELIAAQVDEEIPGGEAWHRELLDRMTQAVPEVRPGVIRPETAVALDEFRKFRHLVRNVYTFNLNPAKMKNLLSALPDSWRSLKEDLTAFASFLVQISHSDETADE